MAIGIFSTNGGDQQPLASAWFRFEANGKCGFRVNDDPDSEFSLDTNSSPRRMKWLYGPCKIELSCQYEIDGDTLKVSFINTGTEVPNAIAPAQNATIFYLKRIKE